MQFNSNSDFPASNLTPEQWHTAARPPPEFEPAPFIPCACLTARVLMRVTGENDSSNSADHPPIDDPQLPHVVVSVNGQQYSVMTAKGVLVQTLQGEGGASGTPSNNNTNNSNANQQQRAHHMSASWSDSSDDESSSDDDVMMDTNDINASSTQQQTPHPHHSHHHHHNTTSHNNTRIERAYWLRGTLRQAIYGHVRYGIVLHKLDPPIRVMLPSSNEWTSVEWEATNEAVAVKEMSWEHIRYQRNRLVEDPIKEVAAMQYLKRWMEVQQEQAKVSTSTLINGIKPPTSTSLPIPPQAMLLPPTNNLHTTSPYLIPQNMLESHVMMPLDLFTDHLNMYSIMPYCSGGELFDVLESKNRFTELEARYWMRQILRGLACLKKAGVAHRDLSLENLLVTDGNVLVIDMGMCLRVPMADGSTNRQLHQNQQRCLILPQGVCGKWGYMSPEVCNNKLPFDGHAVDLLAAGVILFLMLTGFPPWERPVMSDERFKYMTNGYLVQMLTEWNVGLSADAMDLLQRMFWLDPLDRLSLEQVWSHPWMCATQHACGATLGL